MYTRVITADDAAIYRALRLEALAKNPESFLTTYDEYLTRPLAQTAGQLAPTDHSFTLGAFTEDGQLVGMVALVREKQTKVAHIAHLYAMFVAPDFRQRGVGRMLLTTLIEKARQFAGLEQIQLTVVSDNIAAKRLYESVGFTVYGTMRQAMQVSGRYWDELEMVLYLAEEEMLHSKVTSHGVQGFSHVTIDVAHLAQSLDFYVRTLGMEVVHRGRRDVYLTWGTAWVCLQERPELSPLTQQLGVNHVAFYIDPAKFDLLVDVLRQANVPIVRGPLQRGGGWSINFLDPDGVQLECYTATLAERMETWV